MPTDSFEIADSQDLEYNGGATGARLKHVFDGSQQNYVIDALKTKLLAAGWTLEGESYPRASFVFPYGFPIAEVPIVPPVGMPVAVGQQVATVQGVSFRFYDAFRTLPGTTTATTIWIVEGTTVGQSFNNLIAAIEGATDWNLVDNWIATDGSWNFTLEHPTGGTAFNNATQGGTGSAGGYKFWSNGAANGGGGWKLRSTMASGEWLEVWVYSGSTIYFSFTTSREGSPRVLTAGTHDEYTLVANQFQFALFEAGNLDFIFASQPYLQHGCEQAAFICGRGSRGTLSWTGTNTYWGREAPLVQGVSTACGPKAFVLRHSAASLVTSQGFLLVSSAYIGIPQETTDDAVIVGKLWDAVITCKSQPLDEEMFHRGLKWINVFQNGPFGSNVASIWIAYE